MSERLNNTERGFGVYSTGKTTYGQEILVVQSSSAMDDCVWIQFNQPGTLENPDSGDYTPAHLNKEGAKSVIDGLQRWLKEVEND